MRYIGNKTRLLPFIASVLDEFGIVGGVGRGGGGGGGAGKAAGGEMGSGGSGRARAVDAFAGTAAVGGFLKARGFAVTACDLMTYSYVFQRAYVVADGAPSFDGLERDPGYMKARSDSAFPAAVEARLLEARLGATQRESARPLAAVLVYLDTRLPPEAGFISEQFSQTGGEAHARGQKGLWDGEGETAKGRDGLHGKPQCEDSSGPISESHHDGDRPISHAAHQDGVRRMYFTRRNAERIDAIRSRLRLWHHDGLLNDDEFYVLLAALIEASDAVANTTGVYAAFVKTWQPNALRPLRLRVPRLNPGNASEAHCGSVNDVIARVGPVELLYLDPPYNTRQYAGYYHVPELIARGWFEGEPELRGKTGLIAGREQRSEWSRRATCVDALSDLLERSDARHVLMSYNSEGIIPDAEIERCFRAYGRNGGFRRVERPYARYRSDSDGDNRRYKASGVTEYLYYSRSR